MLFSIILSNFAMYKEFGKWLMDIAKYLATSVILATFFNGDKNFDLTDLGILQQYLCGWDIPLGA